MNYWTELSIAYANQKDYLDLLFKVYPMSVNLRRELDNKVETKIKEYFENDEQEKLLLILLKQEIFPIKDSYVAFLKRDNTAISRNPQTCNRLIGMLNEMGYEDIIDKITEPKETNRQIGPLFKRWIDKGSLGCKVTDSEEVFLNYKSNIILNTSDKDMKIFAQEHLGYQMDKGLDFIAKFNNKYVVGEAKFLSDYGGHQNAQFNDAINIMKSDFSSNKEVIPVAILDGVLYLKSRSKMYRDITTIFKDYNILSAIVLRDFLYAL